MTTIKEIKAKLAKMGVDIPRGMTRKADLEGLCKTESAAYDARTKSKSRGRHHMSLRTRYARAADLGSRRGPPGGAALEHPIGLSFVQICWDRL
jgi:hypothetical protein